MTVTTALGTVVAEHIVAVNAFDEDAIVATFADDALVNDAHREFWGTEADPWLGSPGKWSATTLTIEVTEVIDHYGDTIVRGRYDGTYDKTNLPDEIILTNYFTVRDSKIVSLIVIRNTVPVELAGDSPGQPGGPGRSWAAWSGGRVRAAVAVLRHRGGCRGAWRGLPFLVVRVAAVLGGALLPAAGPLAAAGHAGPRRARWPSARLPITTAAA